MWIVRVPEAHQIDESQFSKKTQVGHTGYFIPVLFRSSPSVVLKICSKYLKFLAVSQTKNWCKLVVERKCCQTQIAHFYPFLILAQTFSGSAFFYRLLQYLKHVRKGKVGFKLLLCTDRPFLPQLEHKSTSQDFLARFF